MSESTPLKLRKIAVIAHIHRPETVRVLDELNSWGAKNACTIVCNISRPADKRVANQGNGEFCDPLVAMPDDATLHENFRGADLAITLGGDGTLLFGAHVVASLGIPVLAVNLGSLGFHTQVQPADLLSALLRIQNGEYGIERRIMLAAHLDGGQTGAEGTTGEIFPALNDVVVYKRVAGRMLNLRVWIDDQLATDVFADGVLVASPTGSSAYNYAAGGPVLSPSTDAIVLNAICAHRTGFSPLVLPSSARVAIGLHPNRPDEQPLVLVDGRQLCSLTPGQRLNISRASVYLPLIAFEHDFFEKLREKLSWGGII